MAEAKHPILVVDDEPEMLFSLKSLLRQDFEVHTAEGGARALDELKWSPIHVVMTDQRMPEMNGIELLTRVRAEFPEVVRVLFTGYADLKAVVDAVNKGSVFRYLTKPWDPDDLAGVLRQACDYYTAIAERSRLLSDVRGFVAEGLALPQGRDDGPWAVAGKDLLARLDRNLKGSPSRQ